MELSHKVRRVSTRYSSLLNSKHMLRERERGVGGSEGWRKRAPLRCGQYGGGEKAPAKLKNIMRDQNDLSAISLKQLLVLLTFHQKPTTKTKENIFLSCANKTLTNFLHNRQLFSISQPPTHIIPSLPFPFFPLFPLSFCWPHEFPSWRLDAVCSEFLVSALCPIPCHSLLVIPESWH